MTAWSQKLFAAPLALFAVVDERDRDRHDRANGGALPHNRQAALSTITAPGGTFGTFVDARKSSAAIA